MSTHRSPGQVELLAVGLRADVAQVEDVVDVLLRLRETDSAPARLPAVDVLLAGVVCSQREPLAPVLREQPAQVPRAVADVDLRVVEVRDDETGAARPDRDPLC